MRTIAFTFSLAAVSATFTYAADWNQWRGPNRDGAAPSGPALVSALPDEGLKPLWTSKEEIPSARSGGWSSPVVADGKVFVYTHQRIRVGEDELPPRKFPWLPEDQRTGMTAQEYAEYEVKRRDEDEALGRFYRYADLIYCIDQKSGETVWKYQRNSVYTRFPHSGTPAVVDGRIYVLGAAYTALCVDVKSGELLWQKKLPLEFRDQFMQSSFAISGDVAVVLCGQLFGLNAKTGEILWRLGDDDPRQLHTSPVVWNHAGRELIVCNVPGDETVCVDPRTGEELWRVESLASNSTPVVVGDLMLTYGSSRKGGLRCYDLSLDGADLRWKFHATADSGSSPVVVGDLVFVQGGRRLACVELETGNEAWSTDLDIGNPRYTSLVAADGKVIYAFDGFLCFAANGNEFQTLIDGKIDKDGLLGEQAMFRKQLDIDRLRTTAEGQKEASRLWRQKFDGNGPLTCSTPAIADGQIYIRLDDRVACYDLRAK